MPNRPSFIFILADDLGFADLVCYGGRASVSLALDRMAAEGLRFTDAYANSPVCSPTRFALMTGRLPLDSVRSRRSGVRLGSGINMRPMCAVQDSFKH
jgi:arylsulfatase A-like enzyme